MKRLILTSLFATAAVFAQTGATGSAPKTATSTNAAKHHKGKKPTSSSTGSSAAVKPVAK